MKELVLAGISLAGALYDLLSARLIQARRFPNDRGKKSEVFPITFFRPIKRHLAGLEEIIAALIDAMEPEDQLLLGVDNNADRSLCEELRDRHLEKEIVVIFCRALEGIANPKIAKLLQMEPHARHSHWVISDAEACLDRNFLRDFRKEWQSCPAGILTCGYVFRGARTRPERLDHLSILLTLWRGVALVSRLGEVRFTLGACTGMPREALESIGSWQRFGNYLAEDNRLGTALSSAGRKIVVAKAIVKLRSDRLTWRDYFFHQHRVAFTYRVSAPGGYLAAFITHGVSASVLLIALRPSSMVRWLACGALALVRVRAIRSIAQKVGWEGEPSAWNILLASFAETFFWWLSWFPLSVRWGSRRLRTRRDGSIVADG
jgi:ceramide glucosyltransferase